MPARYLRHAAVLAEHDPTQPDPPVIDAEPSASVLYGKDITFTWHTIDNNIVAYDICVVPDSGATHDQGVSIPNTRGSQNTSGLAINMNQEITTVINGADLAVAAGISGRIEAAGLSVKVFVRNDLGNWSTG